MNLTIDLSEQKAAALEAQARAMNMPTERYLAQIVERALDSQHHRDAAALEQHLDCMAATVLPDTTSEEMETALAEALAHVRPQRNWRP
jgi:hypothetical protein